MAEGGKIAPMLAKIFFDGFEIHVPPEDVAKVVRELQATHVTTSGVVRRSRSSEAQVEAPPMPPPSSTLDPQAAWPFPTGERQSAVKHEDLMMTLAFLDAIQAHAHRQERLDGGIVANVLGVKHPKGIGSKAATINKTLGQLGFNPDDVYKVPRDSLGSRHWVPGRRLEAAFKAIEREVFETVAN